MARKSTTPIDFTGPSAVVVVWLAVMAGTACGAGAVRPRFAPFRDAISDTVRVSPDSAIEIAALLLADEGVELHHVRPVEGYLQTRWFDVTTHDRASPQSADWDSRAVIRIWADAATEDRTLVVAEAAMARVVDPSLPARETEIPVPQDHPVRAMLEHVLELLHTRIEGGADR